MLAARRPGVELFLLAVGGVGVEGKGGWIGAGLLRDWFGKRLVGSLEREVAPEA